MIKKPSYHYTALMLFVVMSTPGLCQQVHNPEKIQPAEIITDFHFTTPLNGWAVGISSILRSKNGGLHWQSIKSDLPYNLNRKLFCLDEEHLWVFDNNPILFTENGGQSWTELFIRERLIDIFDPLNPFKDSLEHKGVITTITDMCFTTQQTGWAIGYIQYTLGISAVRIQKSKRFNFLLKSIDKGISWDTVFVRAYGSGEYPYDLFNEIYFASRQNGWITCNNGSLYFTNDAGKNWNSNILDTNMSLSNITFFNNTEGICYGEKYNGWNIPDSHALFTTIDGGSSWQRKNMDLPLNKVVDISFCSPSKAWLINGNEINSTIPDDSIGIYITYDSGTTWNLQYYDKKREYSKIQMLDSSTGCTVNNYGIFLGTADGKSWHIKNSQFLLSNRITDISFIDSTRGWSTNNDRKIYTTIDGGLTWNSAAEVGAGSALNEICFIDSLYGWMLSISTVYRTTNGGVDWDSTSFNIQINSSFFIDAQYGWLAIVKDNEGRGGTMCTNDSGKTWEFQNVTTPQGMLDIYFVDNKNGWAISGENIVCRTRDGGITWDTTSVRTDNAVNVYNHIQFTDTLHGWLYSTFYGALLRTTDGGKNWIEGTSGLPSGFIGNSFGDMLFKDRAMGWIAGQGFILHSVDSGKTWSPLDSTDFLKIGPVGKGIRLNAIEYHDGHLWVSGESGTLLHLLIDIQSSTALNVNTSKEMYQTNIPAFLLQKGFNTRTITIAYHLEKPCQITAILYTLSGRTCNKIAKDIYKAGVYQLNLTSRQFGTSPLPPGVYLLTVTDGYHHDTARINIINQ